MQVVAKPRFLFDTNSNSISCCSTDFHRLVTYWRVGTSLHSPGTFLEEPRQTVVPSKSLALAPVVFVEQTLNPGKTAREALPSSIGMWTIPGKLTSAERAWSRSKLWRKGSKKNVLAESQKSKSVAVYHYAPAISFGLRSFVGFYS